MLRSRSVTAVTRVCGNIAEILFVRLAIRRSARIRSAVSAHIDKAAPPLENRRFSSLRGRPSVTALLTTNLGATPLLGRGKVRDLYAVGDALLLVATDRISAFDHVLGTGIPGKGKILTQISLFWFDLLSRIWFPTI